MKTIAKKYKDIGGKVMEDNVTITVYDQRDIVLSFRKQGVSIPMTKKDVLQLLLTASAVRKSMGIKLSAEDLELLIEESEN